MARALLMATQQNMIEYATIFLEVEQCHSRKKEDIKMNKTSEQILKSRLTQENFQKLAAIDNDEMHDFVAKYIDLCNPGSVFVSTDSADDIRYVREAAVRNGEEENLALGGHTIHFDGYHDQARDKAQTKFLLPEGVDLGPDINAINKDEGLKELKEIMRDIMKGKEVYVRFYCLGPCKSAFSIPCLQITDSAYVAHSEDLLYRHGYEEFKRLGKSARFFKFVHSAGELDERKVSKNIDKRRVYIDTYDGIVYSVNTQYGGNTIGLKKLAMRLAIKRASEEGWLTEHMLLMGIHGPKGRISYFTGAFPSLCGKTSTSMISGETIVGDDIAYLRKMDGVVRAVNVECGMFGIIQGINSVDDPIIWKTLHSPGEIIFSNVLVTNDKKVYWIGKDGEVPASGYNHSGQWTSGKKDAKGSEITPSHKNARFTLNLKLLENVDSNLDNPAGVALSGIIYGGRDSDTWLPVQESFDWTHGIITKGAALESETTAATLGKEGVRKFNPMSNLDFVSIPLGQYIQNNLDFGKDAKNPPRIFGVNYFIKDKEGNFLNEKTDKAVWLKWMELRVNNDVEAITTPTGLIPKYEDLKRLFKHLLNKDYTQEDYIKQFTLRIPENLAKIDRIEKIYREKVADAPKILFDVLGEERKRLTSAREKWGDYIPPDRFAIYAER